MPFIESKSKKTSLTLWGAGAAVLSSLAGLAGYTMTEADTSEIINAGALVVAGIGGVAAWIGRHRANKTIR